MVNKKKIIIFKKKSMFKYKVVRSLKVLDEGKLNQVGRAGWELCGVVNDEYGYTYYLKKKES